MPLGIRPINDMAFKKTFGTPENKLCLISLEDKAMYDSREKAIRDYQSAINAALREGEQKGLLEGQEKGLAERERRGKVMGKIATLQGILGIAQTDDETFRCMSIDALDAMASQLQESVRSRLSS